MTESAEKNFPAYSHLPFIIDSDRVRLDIDGSIHKEADKRVSIRRFQMFDDGPKLVEPKNAGLYTETELEDCLDAGDFYRAAENIISQEYELFSKHFTLNKTADYTNINDGLKFILPKGSKAYQEMGTIKHILSSHKTKYNISKNYISTKPLPWVDEVNSYFD